MSIPNKILIVGASARAAAYSARRAGMTTWAIDLFGDSDLRQICNATRVQSLSINDLDQAELPSMPNNFLLAGGMENRIKLLNWLSKKKCMVGAPIDGIVRVKDPIQLKAVCQRHVVRFPMVANEIGEFRRSGEWLLKPKLSAGGSGIRIFDDPCRFGLDSGCYLQQRVKGRSMSSVFCRASSQIQLIGTAEQLVGCAPFTVAKNSFVYCGSIGPLALSSAIATQIVQLGKVVSDEFDIVGIFGVDWILDENGECWLIEVNPRWTSSCEIYERSGVVSSIVANHCLAFFGDRSIELQTKRCISGKAIIYNEDKWLDIDRQFVDELSGQRTDNDWPPFADIPNVGQTIAPFAPIVTLFADENSSALTQHQLEIGALKLRQRIKKLEAAAPS